MHRRIRIGADSLDDTREPFYVPESEARDLVRKEIVTIARRRKSARKAGVARRLLNVLRQAAVRHGVGVGPMKIDGIDLERVHAVVTEIDSRRVFYERYVFESPPHCVESVQQARVAIRARVAGVWGDPVLELLVQDLQATLADFVSRSQLVIPKQGPMWLPDIAPFISELAQMRIRVWTLVGMLHVMVGDIVRPRHLAEFLVDEVRAQA